ncbi:MAG: hypothetical protein ACR2GL_02500 [Thermoleophilaceae bacterium]
MRLERAATKQRIRRGELRVADIVLACPWQIEGMSISDLLLSQRRWGASRCRRLLTAVGIPEDKKVGTLTERQRRALVSGLEAPATPKPYPLRPATETRVALRS